MWLLLVESEIDVVAVTDESCYNCTETKLGTKVLRVWHMQNKEFKRASNYIKGFRVHCICDNYNSFKPR
jgi:hypothetical protein